MGLTQPHRASQGGQAAAPSQSTIGTIYWDQSWWLFLEGPCCLLSPSLTLGGCLGAGRCPRPGAAPSTHVLPPLPLMSPWELGKADSPEPVFSSSLHPGNNPPFAPRLTPAPAGVGRARGSRGAARRCGSYRNASYHAWGSCFHGFCDSPAASQESRPWEGRPSPTATHDGADQADARVPSPWHGAGPSLHPALGGRERGAKGLQWGRS